MSKTDAAAVHPQTGASYRAKDGKYYITKGVIKVWDSRERAVIFQHEEGGADWVYPLRQFEKEFSRSYSRHGSDSLAGVA